MGKGGDTVGGVVDWDGGGVEGGSGGDLGVGGVPWRLGGRCRSVFRTMGTGVGAGNWLVNASRGPGPKKG